MRNLIALFILIIVRGKRWVMNNNIFDIYCDESCHLEHDKAKYMVIGAVYSDNQFTKEISSKIKEIKANHGFKMDYEIKWTKLTKANIELATDLLKYFYNCQYLNFRGYVIDKSVLNHKHYNQTHDLWYYKMFYTMLEFIIYQNKSMNIYIDIKDTRSSDRITKLMNVINNKANYLNIGKVLKLQSIRSHESQIMQITDLFIGSLRYYYEGLNTSSTKYRFINKLKEYYPYKLEDNSPLSYKKFNYYKWNNVNNNEVEF